MSKKTLTKKKIDYEKKFENLKKQSQKDIEHLRGELNTITEEKNKYYDKLQEKKKGYVIEIKAQTHTIIDLERAKERVKKLMEAGVWYFEVKEAK